MSAHEEIVNLFVGRPFQAVASARKGRPTGDPGQPKDLPPPAPPQPLFRWSDAHRQEALDLHCQLQKLPPTKLAQARGIPDPASMTPKEYIERGRPYCITIDLSAEYDRLWQLNQQVWDEQEAEMRRNR